MLEIFVVSFPLCVLGNWLTATKPVIDHKYQDIRMDGVIVVVRVFGV